MVRRYPTRDFVRGEGGVALVEGLIVFPLMVLAIAACVEFGFVLNQWTLASKAMQLAVRRLIVSDPATTDFNTVFAFDPAQGGKLIAANSTITSSCDGDPSTATPDCRAGVLDWLINGPGTSPTTWPGLARFFPSVAPKNIKITYEQSGLGYQGRPEGPVVTVRLQVQAPATDLPILGPLFGFAGIYFPPFVVTATSEDLKG